MEPTDSDGEEAKPVKAKKEKKSKKTKDGEEKPEKKKRAPSQYNIFIGEMIKKLSLEENPIPSNERMKQAQVLWKEHKAAETVVA